MEQSLWEKVKGLPGAARLEAARQGFRWPLLLWWTAAFLGGVLCARCRFLEALLPAGLAWVTAWGSLGLGLFPAALGVGTAWIVLREWSLVPALTALLLLMVLRSFVELLYSRSWTGYAALLIAHLVPLFRPQLPLELLTGLWNLTLALAFYTAFTVTGNWLRSGARQPEPEHGVCLALSLGALLAGLPRNLAGAADAAGFVMSAVTLACALLHGASGGGTAGVACALALYLSGQADLTLFPILGGAGLAAGAVFRAGAPAAALVYAAASVSLSLLVSGAPFAAAPWPAMALGLGAVLLVPRGLWERFQGRMEAESPAFLPPPPAQEEASVRLLRFSECFSELAELFSGQDLPEELPWEEAMPLLQAVAKEACTDCPRRTECWRKRFSQTASALLDAARTQERERRILWEEDFDPAFRERCPRLSYVTEALRSASGEYALHRGQMQEIRRCRELLGRQLSGAGKVMAQLSRDLRWVPDAEGDRARQIRTRLLAEGIPVRGLQWTRDGSGRERVTLVTDACGGERRCVKVVSPILESVCGCPMAWQPAACGEAGGQCRLTFVQARLLQIQSSAMQWAAQGECGDACLRLSLGRKGYLLALSDGMGVGEAASRESQRLLRLVESFYRAGFEEELIFSTLNEMLLLRETGETFATLDVCLIDLVNARAHFVKLGAAPSFLIRDGRAETVSASSLPMGIVEEARPSSRTVEILPGDLIVLASDGVAGGDAALGDRLTELAQAAPEKIARTLLSEAEKREDLRPDDRSVLVARILASPGDKAEEARLRRMQRWREKVS